MRLPSRTGSEFRPPVGGGRTRPVVRCPRPGRGDRRASPPAGDAAADEQWGDEPEEEGRVAEPEARPGQVLGEVVEAARVEDEPEQQGCAPDNRGDDRPQTGQSGRGGDRQQHGPAHEHDDQIEAEPVLESDRAPDEVFARAVVEHQDADRRRDESNDGPDDVPHHHRSADHPARWQGPGGSGAGGRRRRCGRTGFGHDGILPESGCCQPVAGRPSSRRR